MFCKYHITIKSRFLDDVCHFALLRSNINETYIWCRKIQIHQNEIKGVKVNSSDALHGSDIKCRKRQTQINLGKFLNWTICQSSWMSTISRHLSDDYVGVTIEYAFNKCKHNVTLDFIHFKLDLNNTKLEGFKLSQNYLKSEPCEVMQVRLCWVENSPELKSVKILLQQQVSIFNDKNVLLMAAIKDWALTL